MDEKLKQELINKNKFLKKEVCLFNQILYNIDTLIKWNNIIDSLTKEVLLDDFVDFFKTNDTLQKYLECKIKGIDKKISDIERILEQNT